MILRVRQRRRATTLVEMAFVSLACLIFMFAIFEYGRYVMIRQIMQNAARTGARSAAVMSTSYISTTTATNDITAIVTDQLAGQQLQNLAISVYSSDTSGKNTGAWTGTTFGKDLVVQIDADLTLMFPVSFTTQFGSWTSIPNSGAAPNSAHLTVKSMMHSEAN